MVRSGPSAAHARAYAVAAALGLLALAMPPGARAQTAVPGGGGHGRRFGERGEPPVYRNIPLRGAAGVAVQLTGREAQPRNLKRLWGSSATDVWAVGHYCEILRWDGNAWTRISGGRVEGRTATFCGEPREPPDMFEDVWGSSATDVWIVGGYKRRATILHWDGAAWSRTSTAPSKRKGGLDDWSLSAVWGTSATDVWAFGGHGTILHWDGEFWTRFASPSPGAEISAAWGSSARDVWAVGKDVDYGYRRPPSATILHWDGVAWSSVAPGVAVEELTGVWGSSATDVWAVGKGALLRWDGRAWSSAGAAGEAAAVWGRSARDVWTFGATIRRFDGRAWNEIPSQGATAGWGDSARDVWAISGEGLLRWDGARWSGDAPVVSLLVSAAAAPSHPFRGLSPTIEAKSDTFAFSGAHAGWHATPAKVTIPYDPARAGFPSPYCWSPGDPIVDDAGRVTFSGEGQFVGGQLLNVDEQGRRLSFATSLLTECVLVGISQEKERAYAERQRASVRKALGITEEEAAAALARAAWACERRAARAAKASRPMPPAAGSAAALLGARPLAAILPTARDVPPARKELPGAGPRSALDRPRAAFASGLRPFELRWTIDPAEPDDRLSERVLLVPDPCPAGEAGSPPERGNGDAGFAAIFRALPFVQTAAGMSPAEAIPYLTDVGDELHPGGDRVVKTALALAIREEGPFFDIVEEARPVAGEWYTVHGVTHWLVLRSSVVEGGRFLPAGRNRRTVAAVLDALWYGGANGLVAEAIADRETERFVVRDYVVANPGGGASLLRLAVDKRDGAVFLLPLTLGKDGKRVEGPAAIDVGTGVEYR